MNELVEKIKNELTINDLKEMVSELNSWNGSLDWLEYYENDEDFFDLWFPNNPDEAVRSVCYGSYEYMDDYVRFNAYGNLESCSEYEYEKEIEENAEEIINTYIEEIDNMENGKIKNLIKNILDEGENNEK